MRFSKLGFGLTLGWFTVGGCFLQIDDTCESNADCKSGRVCQGGSCVGASAEGSAGAATSGPQSEWEVWGCFPILSPEPRKSLSACAKCPDGFRCVQQRLTSNVYCVRPCSTAAQCSCGNRPMKCAPTILDDTSPVVSPICLASQ
jgi:hypothetical protein